MHVLNFLRHLLGKLHFKELKKFSGGSLDITKEILSSNWLIIKLEILKTRFAEPVGLVRHPIGMVRLLKPVLPFQNKKK